MREVVLPGTAFPHAQTALGGGQRQVYTRLGRGGRHHGVGAVTPPFGAAWVGGAPWGGDS